MHELLVLQENTEKLIVSASNKAESPLTKLACLWQTSLSTPDPVMC